ncbi:beta-ketoacyl synthase [Legionella sp. W05-934-2]|uniref:beta-ketoacyl-[acyl-carrier-protein] synthase family protein n=1 Tax=Legionella sp. W05-934-2 TaxID=1198649 RepID=UPI0034622CF9
MHKRVVVTGMGILSSIGQDIPSFWQAAISGQSGIKHLTQIDVSNYPTRIGGEIGPLTDEQLPHIEKRQRFTRVAQYAIYCLEQALQQAKLDTSIRQSAGIYMGTGWGGTPEIESGFKDYFLHGWKKIPPMSVIKGMPNSITNHLAMLYDIRGPNMTLSNACISSAEAIGVGFENIQRGKISTAICGGSESLLWASVLGAWCRLKVMSTQNEHPQKSCRPFDANRDGMVIADGAGVMILEELEQARARGAHIYAEIIGFGQSCDAHHITAPKSEGQAAAIEAALNQARVSPNDIQYINAHGTATKLNDLTETQTIKHVFGNRAYQIPITAQKSMTGHAIGAAGVLEIITTCLAIENGILPPTINLDNPDEQCDLDYIPHQARHKQIDIALSNHFAFGGANAALILQRFFQ